jgi:Flp pilus assembly protein TadB
MLMIASISCGVLAIVMSLLIGMSMIIAIPGLVVGAFFAFRYVMYGNRKASEEQEDHRRRRKRH